MGAPAAGDAPPDKPKKEKGGKKDSKEGKDKDDKKGKKGSPKPQEEQKGGKGKDKGDKGAPKEKITNKEKESVETKSLISKKVMESETQEEPVSASEIAREEATYRAAARRAKLHKRRWPSVTKVNFKTKPWHPPGPPEKIPKVMIDYPPLKLVRWIPPYMRRRRGRPKLPRVNLDEIEPPQYEGKKLTKVWHNFQLVDTNKMMVQGTQACNSKRYGSKTSGSQTGCIALVCRALLDEKTPAELTRRDVDDVIQAGDRFYRQCVKTMKCYKGKAALELQQLLSTFYFNGFKYMVGLKETDRGALAKSPDNANAGADLMDLMEKRAGTNYMCILTVGGDKHFLIWGHPPSNGGNVKTVCYLFDPHMLDERGEKTNVYGAGAFLRYPGVTSFVIDFINNYGDLKQAKRQNPKPHITLTDVEVITKEPIPRPPGYSLDLKTMKPHCYAEWEAWNINALIDEKKYKGKYPLASLSAVSLATSRKSSRRNVRDFFMKGPKGPPPPVLPVMPEKPPPPPTNEQIMQLRGSDFFLHCPKIDAHFYGRDDMIPFTKSETTIMHSPVEIADQNFTSQYRQLDSGKSILRGTRHFASYRYQTFKYYTGVACCVAALAMLRKLRGRAWNEDTVDETLDVGWNLFRESLMELKGPIRRLVLGELKKTFKIRDLEYKHKERNVAVWGKLISNKPKVFDLCRGIEHFFKEADTGILQIPGEYETAIWYEGGRFFLYHPWPADRYGTRVGLQGGGKACVVSFSDIQRMCDYFMDNVRDMKRKPFSISDVVVYDLGSRPEAVNNMKPIGVGSQSRWMVRGNMHEADESFPEEHRGKQATPTSIAAIAMAALVDPATWTPEDIDEVLKRGDILYEKTMEHLDKLGINLETPNIGGEEGEAGPEEEEMSAGTTGTLAAADVLPRFKISDLDCIETEVQDSAFTGQLNAEPGSGVLSLKDSLKAMFKENKAAVVTARGGSVAVWQHDDHYYFFDPHGCDENGIPSDDTEAGACLIRLKPSVEELADIIMGNLPPGADDSFNMTPVEILHAKLNPELGAPEIKQEGKAYEWLNKNTATILMGPRGQNSALGKAAKKACIGDDDMAGRTLALPAAAAFCAAADAVPPPAMHQDHIFNFLDAAADYYNEHVKRTGRKDITVEDLGERFELGANTFSIEVGEPTRMPLRLPDQPEEGGGEEEEKGGPIYGEGEEIPEPGPKQMKEYLYKLWYDTTKQNGVYLLLGDYHQLGLWMTCEGKVVAFDPAPTLAKGLLTPQRVAKGDALRTQRLKEEKPAEGGDEEDEEEAEGEGEEKPEPEPEFVPPESCPVLMTFNCPGEFIDKLVEKGGLGPAQMVAPYWLYPVTVTNELTATLKEKKGGGRADEEGAEGEDVEAEDTLVDSLDETAMGKHFKRTGRTTAALRGCVRQDEAYFQEDPNRDHQDAANVVMGIVVNSIEPYTHWKPALVDAILKYGDRLYTLSAPNARRPPTLKAAEIAREFHVTNFNVKLDIEGDVVEGDIKAGDSGRPYNLVRGLRKFFESNQYAVVCAKGYCAGVWKAEGDKAWVYWDPHGTGPTGKSSPESAAGVVIFSSLEELADTLKNNVLALSLPGPNKFTISSVNVSWEFSQVAAPVTPMGAVPDEGYEWKVLTAFVEYARGRTILRGSRPSDAPKFSRESLLASAPAAIVAACMSHIRRPHLWTRKTVDEIMSNGLQLFTKSIANLGYEFRPGEDVLLPLQVVKRFQLGTNYVRYELDSAYSGKLELRDSSQMHLRAAVERFFESHTHGILWCTPHAVAVWRVIGAPSYYMMEPHATGATGLRTDGMDDIAASVLTFTSPKLLAYGFLQNYPVEKRPMHNFNLYAISVTVAPIKRLGKEPPLIKAIPGKSLVPATSKLGVDGKKRRARESDREHPPGSPTCLDAARAAELCDRDETLKGTRNANGWLVVPDGTQYMSARHSMSCKRYAYASRGHQALACSVMAVAMSRVEDVCRWCDMTLDHILDSGDQLYQDSYLHYRPRDSHYLGIEQILRKFYTPGNCVCRVVVYKARQTGTLGDSDDLTAKLTEFFREERAGVFVAGNGQFAVALFKTPRGFYMFDPADRDRFGRAVAPPCIGRARACFSQYPTVRALAQKLGANIPPMNVPPPPSDGEVRFDNKTSEASQYAIYGMGVSSLRRLNQYEK